MAFNYSKLLNPEVLSAGVGLVGGALQGAGQANLDKQNREQRKREIILQQLTGAARDDTDEDLTRAKAGLEATQMDPFMAARAQARMDIARQLFGNASNVSTSFDPSSGQGSISGGISLPSNMDLSALSPERLGSASRNFYENVGRVQPAVAAPDLGYGDDWRTAIDASRSAAQSGIDVRRQTREKAIQDFLAQDAGSADQKKGTPWWKKALGIGGNIGLALATGGMSLPAQIAINAAGGAGIGALTGGKKGALTGALTGAATPALGGLTKAAPSPAPSFLSQINPKIARSIRF